MVKAQPFIFQNGTAGYSRTPGYVEVRNLRFASETESTEDILAQELTDLTTATFIETDTVSLVADFVAFNVNSNMYCAICNMYLSILRIGALQSANQSKTRGT